MVHAQSECGLAPAQFEEEGDLARGRERQLTTTRAAKKNWKLGRERPPVVFHT